MKENKRNREQLIEENNIENLVLQLFHVAVKCCERLHYLTDVLAYY